jgi:O-antigen/teichoic acid export membrane protein
LIRFSDKLQLIGSSYLQQVIRILTVFVMARLIGPNDNGIFMLVIYVAGLVMALNDFAIPQSLIQIHDFPEQMVVDTALVLNGLLYTFYGLFALGAGVYLTHKDPGRDPHYWRIGAIVAITNLLASQYNVQLARLNRNLNFRAESRQNIIFALSTATTGIIFALLHYGAYALALQVLAGQVAANIAITFRVRLAWPRQVSFAVVRRFLTLGTPASVAAYVGAVEASIIGLIIKPIDGTVGLGLWSKTIQVQQLFGQNLLTSFQRVAYPLVCHSVSDPPRMRKLFARVTLTLMLVSLLFTGVVVVNSEAMVRVCLGRDWKAAAPLLRVAAWAIPAGALNAVANILCMAMGITKSFVKASVLNLCIFIPAALLVRHWGGGLLELAVCWSVSRYLIALTTLQAATSRLGAGLRDIWRPLSGLIGSATAAAAIMLAVRTLGEHVHVRLPIQLAVSGSIGVIVYIGSVWLLEANTIADAMRMARGGASAPADEPVLEGAMLETPLNPLGEAGLFSLPPQPPANPAGSKDRPQP